MRLFCGRFKTGPPSLVKGKEIMLIQRLRDGSDGILAKVIVGLIIIVFGLFGFGGNGQWAGRHAAGQGDCGRT
jgi:hypothetical protein